MRVLIVGGGGREHALAWAVRRELPGAVLHLAPGNAGTAELGRNLPIKADDIDRLADAADAYGIDLAIVGPEVPLAAGLADRLRFEGRRVVGPSAAAARIEASKAFAKDVMARAGVRTAPFATFGAHQLGEALAHVARHAEPIVVKASGLAAGKGAVVCESREHANAMVQAMLGDGAFGEAGRTVVIEGFLRGEELSVLAITDGTDVELLPAAQDHKRVGEGDTGPNTGGMGAYAPVTIADARLLDRVREEVLGPVLHRLRRDGTPFSGILFAGLMVEDGTPSVIEFNCRLGDPETEAVLPLVTGGLVECLDRVARGERPSPLALSADASVTTVVAAAGYPEPPRTGDVIHLPDTLPDGVTLFHAGTMRDDAGRLRTAGGRVMAVTALAPTFAEAQARSRAAADAVGFEGKVWRRDIGWREAARRG
ncbi:MAG: phosphoribosylamine--glycine ligase [Gemmatimonadales bacterium]|nr:phosphoribosylamine--glycine ligase [Gemmatimonadales bacterium]